MHFVKMVWVYVMLGSATGFVALLLSVMDKFDARETISISTIIRAVLSAIFLVLTVIAFLKARKLGLSEDKEESEIRRRWIRGDYNPR